MTDAEQQAILDKETPEQRALRDAKADLRNVLAALNDLPFGEWPEQLRVAVGLCDREDVAVAKSMWLNNLSRRYRDA